MSTVEKKGRFPFGKSTDPKLQPWMDMTSSAPRDYGVYRVMAGGKYLYIGSCFLRNLSAHFKREELLARGADAVEWRILPKERAHRLAEWAIRRYLPPFNHRYRTPTKRQREGPDGLEIYCCLCKSWKISHLFAGGAIHRDNPACRKCEREQADNVRPKNVPPGHFYPTIIHAAKQAIPTTCRWCDKPAMSYSFMTGACSEHRKNLAEAVHDNVRRLDTVVARRQWGETQKNMREQRRTSLRSSAKPFL